MALASTRESSASTAVLAALDTVWYSRARLLEEEIEEEMGIAGRGSRR